MSLPIGFSTTEGISNGASAFIEGDKHTIGILWERERGIPNKPVLIGSIQDDRRRNGGIFGSSYGAYVARMLFNNAGSFGATVYGVRIVGDGSEAAYIDAEYVPTDNQEWNIRVLVSGSETQREKKAYYPINPEVGDEFSIEGISFTVTDATPKNVAENLTALLNNDNGFAANFIATDRGDYIEIEARNVNVPVDLDDDVSGVTAPVVTPETKPEAIMHWVPLLPEDTTLEITVTAFGVIHNLGTFTYTYTDITYSGVSEKISDVINAGTSTHGFSAEQANSNFGVNFIAPEGVGANWNSRGIRVTLAYTFAGGSFGTYSSNAFSGGVNAVLGTIPFCTFKAGQIGMADPGLWGNNLKVVTYPYGSLGVGVCGLQIFYKNVRVEEFSAPTFQEVINKLNANSYYLTISDYNEGHLPGSVQTFNLSGGTYVAPSGESDFYPYYDNNEPRGMAAFDGLNVQIIACAEYHSATMALQGREYCASSSNGNMKRVYVCCTPQFASTQTLASFSQALQTSTTQGAHVAAYHMWNTTSDENGGKVWVPSLGWILGGGYVRVPQLNLDQIWIAPAGLESVGTDIIDVFPDKLSQTDIDLIVKTYTINVPVFRRGSGYYILTSRTMSTNSLFQSVHIRRFTNFLLKTIEDNLQWLGQKPNTPEIRAQMVNQLTQYFRTLYNDGGLERSLPFDDAFKVVCDKSNNPPTQNRKELNIDLYWVPTECIEAVGIRLNRNDGILLLQNI